MRKGDWWKLIIVVFVVVVGFLLMDKDYLPSELDKAQKYLNEMKSLDSTSWFRAHGYILRMRNNYNSSVVEVEVDRSFSVNISAENLNKVFEKVEYSYSLVGINLKICLDDTLLSVGYLKSVRSVRNALKKSRNHKEMIHIIIADEINSQTFGWTQFYSAIKFPNQEELDKVGIYIFYNNIREYSDVDSITFDYSDTIITTGELLVKVLVHEIGHSLCLVDNPGSYFEDSRYSVMNQGYRIVIVNGPNNRGPEFSERDLKCIDLNMILGIDRTMKYLKIGCDPQNERKYNQKIY